MRQTRDGIERIFVRGAIVLALLAWVAAAAFVG